MGKGMGTRIGKRKGRVGDRGEIQEGKKEKIRGKEKREENKERGED